MVTFMFSFTKFNGGKLTISNTHSTEELLVAGIMANNKQSLDRLYQMYSASLMGIISRIVKYDEIAEDVLQDVFVKIWKSIAQYDSSKGKLFTWMANLAKNAAIDQIRSKSYINNTKTDDIANLPLATLAQQSHVGFNPEIIGMRQLLDRLKKDQKDILKLVYFEGYTQVEIAEQLNMPLGTVKTKIRLSILLLRQFFNEEQFKKAISA